MQGAEDAIRGRARDVEEEDRFRARDSQVERGGMGFSFSPPTPDPRSFTLSRVYTGGGFLSIPPARAAADAFAEGRIWYSGDAGV